MRGVSRIIPPRSKLQIVSSKRFHQFGSLSRNVRREGVSKEKSRTALDRFRAGCVETLFRVKPLGLDPAVNNMQGVLQGTKPEKGEEPRVLHP